jgi:hypothetical protein
MAHGYGSVNGVSQHRSLHSIGDAHTPGPSRSRWIAQDGQTGAPTDAIALRDGLVTGSRSHLQGNRESDQWYFRVLSPVATKRAMQ